MVSLVFQCDVYSHKIFSKARGNFKLNLREFSEGRAVANIL